MRVGEKHKMRVSSLFADQKREPEVMIDLFNKWMRGVTLSISTFLVLWSWASNPSPKMCTRIITKYGLV